MRTPLTAARIPLNAQRHGSTPPPSKPSEQVEQVEQVEEVEERSLSFEGFAYECRIVHQSAPRTAPLLLLGGSSQDRYSWQAHEKWLAPLCTLITVDLPGYGSADFLPSRYGIDFLAAAVKHMLVETGMPQVNLFGGCFGEVVGLRFAQLHPEFVRRIVFCGAAKRLPEIYTDVVPRLSHAFERGDNEAAVGGLVRLFMSNPGAGKVRRHAAVTRLLQRQFMSQTPDEIKKALEHNTRLVTHGCYEPLPVPDVPTLVFTGEYDTLCTPEMGRELAATMPSARFTTVREADHLVTVERREESSELIGRFCTDLPIDGLPYCTAVESPGTELAGVTPSR
ncbi:alpha/beta hydrolase [Streptomyces sp. M2CJ-2]|uniref:alpha/beta fold hydrolase n=1 Tax=Streptomyces sp. M2CJ-2 TaxID=2803948 RepID=UPI00192173B9|nr:alpha/beta hydrolase [Streptomyces sp. M2CJ-2]MBL3666381.1 alpha/beta hydrolase [Streptomyces sp. M2CJ-2]